MWKLVPLWLGKSILKGQMKEPPYDLVKMHLTKVILDPELDVRQLILQDNSFNDGTSA